MASDKPVTYSDDISLSALFASPGLFKDEMRSCQIDKAHFNLQNVVQLQSSLFLLGMRRGEETSVREGAILEIRIQVSIAPITALMGRRR